MIAEVVEVESGPMAVVAAGVESSVNAAVEWSAPIGTESVYREFQVAAEVAKAVESSCSGPSIDAEEIAEYEATACPFDSSVESVGIAFPY